MSHPMRALGRSVLLATGASGLILSPTHALSQSSPDPALVLDPIRVQSDQEETDTAATSAVEAADLQTRYSGNPQTALNALPGVSTRQSSNQPGIEVNIRGLSGFGRVNAMIDGVPQSFKNSASHESSGGSLLYVQPEFLSAIEVERGAVSGAAGNGTLAGAANFRTLSLDDILLDGRTEGGMTRLKFGDNGYEYSGLVTYGKRFEGLWNGAGHADILLGYAKSDEGNYATGDGELDDGSAGRGSANTPEGRLVKIVLAPSEAHELSFGLLGYENTFQNSSYTWDVDNRTYTADYAYRPGSDLINLDLSAYYNDTTLTYPGTGGSYAGRETEEETYGLSLSNRSHLVLSGGHRLVLDYGLSWTRDDFQTHSMRGGNHPGTLDKASLFADATLDMGATTLFGGLRYDYWRADGYRPPYSAGVADCPAGGPDCGDEWVDRDGGTWLPKIGIRHAVNEALTLEASYAHTFRPPTTHEMFYALAPFGDGVGSGMTNNLDLDPETSRTLELSAHYRQQGLLTAGDSAWLRVTAFQSRIENYIVNEFVDVPGDPYSRAMWVNTDGTTRMRGLEVEGGYDSGKVYANLSLSISDTDDQPYGQGTGMGNGMTSAQPERMATLDIGLRTLEERLTLGTQVRYVGESQQAAFDWGSYPDGAYMAETDSYTLVDLYGSYAITDAAQLFFSVENLFDESYGYPGGSAAAYEEMTGRGRTVTAGLTTRF